MPSGYGSATGGATLTTEQVEALLVEPLYAQSVLLGEEGDPLTPQIFTTRGVPVRVPTIDAITIADPWRAENTAIAEVDPSFGEVVLLPSTLKSVKVIHRLSNELVRHSVVDISSVLETALVTKLAQIVDTALLFGTGGSPAGTMPVGIFNTSGVGTITGVGVPVVFVTFGQRRVRVVRVVVSTMVDVAGEPGLHGPSVVVDDPAALGDEYGGRVGVDGGVGVSRYGSFGGGLGSPQRPERCLVRWMRVSSVCHVGPSWGFGQASGPQQRRRGHSHEGWHATTTVHDRAHRCGAWRGLYLLGRATSHRP